jgi:hypothetical protein
MSVEIEVHFEISPIDIMESIGIDDVRIQRAEDNFEDYSVGIKCYYTPARPMPFCTNPNKDAYYDPGDPEEFEFVLPFDLVNDFFGRAQELSIQFSKEEKESIKGVIDDSYDHWLSQVAESKVRDAYQKMGEY